MLSKYYDDVLTFTYEYVILKDYTLLPIKDTFVNRRKNMQNTIIMIVSKKKITDFTE